MLSGRSRRLPSPPDEAALGPELPLALPTVPATHAAAQARRTSTAGARGHRRRWPRLARRVLIPPALLLVVLVPPQSLRATLVTLLIIAALGIVVWRLPMADDD